MRRLENITPQDFEQHVREVLAAFDRRLKAFKTDHLELIQGMDGQYEFDVTARFEALGVDFLVLIECKHQKDAVKRDVLQVLRDKMQAVGAHKGMVFSTAPFQRGAREYATHHRIALVHVTDSGLVYIRKAAGMQGSPAPASWIAVRGEEMYRTLDDNEGIEILRELLFNKVIGENDGAVR